MRQSRPYSRVWNWVFTYKSPKQRRIQLDVLSEDRYRLQEQVIPSIGCMPLLQSMRAKVNLTGDKCLLVRAVSEN